MNIFYLSHDQEQCAKWHNNSHVVKMILETAQILSTAHRVLDGKLEIVNGKKSWNIYRIEQGDGIVPWVHNKDLYRATHINHPSCIWARQSDANYEWLFGLFVALCAEYTFRYGKEHKSSRLINVLKYIPKNIPNGNFTQPTQAMPDECKVPNDSITAYRNYYMTNKSHLAKWKNRPVPEWYIQCT